MSAAVMEISPWQLVLTGGPVLAPILICSVFALTVVIRRFDELRSFDADLHILKDLVFLQVRQNNLKEAVRICGASASWAAAVFKAGLMKYGGSRQEIMDAMEDAARLEVPKLEKGLVILSTIAHITPLLGFLGTVVGLCGTFHTIQVRAAAMNPVTQGDIAADVWQALIATAISLVVAIPVFIVYNYFVDRIYKAVRDLEKAVMRLADLMTRISDIGLSGKE